jgi:hypothetical protein
VDQVELAAVAVELELLEVLIQAAAAALAQIT